MFIKIQNLTKVYKEYSAVNEINFQKIDITADKLPDSDLLAQLLTSLSGDLESLKTVVANFQN